MSAKSSVGITLFLALAASTASATPQIPDEIKYKGYIEKTWSWPLESYVAPAGQKAPTVLSDLWGVSTACRRGYIATWEVKDGFLYLVSVWESKLFSKGREIELSRIRPDWKSPVKAEWFTGILKMPQGNTWASEAYHGETLLIDFRKGEKVREGSINWSKYEQGTELRYKYSAPWRTYIATWEINNGLLYLVSLREGKSQGEGREIELSEVWREWKSPAKAEWVTRLVKIPQGEGLNEDRDESLYGTTLLIDIRDGKVIRKGTLTWRKCEQEHTLDKK